MRFQPDDNFPLTHADPILSQKQRPLGTSTRIGHR
jgi:hypothetical protein